ncbi:deaminase domain-containing protein [Peribacillus butanolivorans]
MSGIGSDAYIAIIFQNSVVTIRKELLELGYPRKEKKGSGNVALSLFHMPPGMKEYRGDIPLSFKAYSKISKPEDKGAEKGFVLLNEGHDLMIHGMELSIFDEDEWRKNDTERKILGRLHKQLKQRAEELNIALSDFPGELHLYTEKTPCEFCLQAILHFQRTFKKVNIYVYYDKIVDKLKVIYERKREEVITLHKEGKTIDEISEKTAFRKDDIESIIKKPVS